MHSLSGTLIPRFLIVLLAVILILTLLATLFLLHMHTGATHMFVQSTEGILD